MKYKIFKTKDNNYKLLKKNQRTQNPIILQYSTFILYRGLDKKLVLNMITYYEFMVRNLAGVLMHPETLKNIEKVHYAIEHNLPVKR